MKYRIHKLNRHLLDPAGYKFSVLVHNMLDFHSVRQWLSQTYGYSNEVVHEQFIRDGNTDHCWTWSLQYNSYFIYLRSNKELAWFKLKFGS